VVSDRGAVQCLEPATGKTLWAGELPRSSASYFSSPVAAGGGLYASREDGTVFVVRLDERYELLAENHLKEPIIGSPVPMEGRLFIRGERHLFCIGTQ
jgi:hypothetical protein